MLEMDLIVGCVMMIVCLVIQCIVVSMLVRLLVVLERKNLIRTSVVGISTVLIVTLIVMLAGNIAQMTLWAWLFLIFGEFEELATAFYHSVVNFTTLGYGDLVMSKQGRLLGALEAANGVLMFGLTTSALFALLHNLSQRALNERLSNRRNPGESLSQ
jgi:hypothetical protein